jgi:hypothetical protein
MAHYQPENDWRTWVIGVILTLMLAFGGAIYGKESRRIDGIQEDHKGLLPLPALMEVLNQRQVRIEEKLDRLIERQGGARGR